MQYFLTNFKGSEMNKRIITRVEPKYFTELTQEQILNSFESYVQKIENIKNNTKHHQVSQDEYFRVKANFANVTSLIEDLLTIPVYKFRDKTAKLFENFKLDSSLIMQFLCIDYTAKDLPTTAAYFEDGASKNLISYETSYVLSDTLFVTFVPLHEYQYVILSSAEVEIEQDSVMVSDIELADEVDTAEIDLGRIEEPQPAIEIIESNPQKDLELNKTTKEKELENVEFNPIQKMEEESVIYVTEYLPEVHVLEKHQKPIQHKYRNLPQSKWWIVASVFLTILLIALIVFAILGHLKLIKF
ncbi:hypothetical protein MCAL160_0660 [Mycoplasmopsis californica HAZ160_1]|uniref:Uncharacterized protein n=2 Tax=Mycoplasmopsis californica TaxID=2113 RepID=A0AAT9F8H5_9BACT|nr:hypothetical protein MCAL160_0660 [Mycoplasmopsis californica HAZ160_1]BBG40997.1 hypothetical protein MCAL106_0660 [Mycoplasmopsis californica]BBG41590.1 hypothetical protein MCAL106E_0660 [Mycoplasmopsis californica]BBG42184.1 hypothetical protein MCAL106L_0660 [Mycoplasmopsis californica]BBG42766.1 hypothetical protein MCAL160E_0660 [Mycoplasmopsis californica]